MNKTISAANAPAAVGPYCHAKLAGNTLYTSGQLGLVPATGALPEGVEAQARQALDNLGAVLQAAGMDFADVTKTTVFLTDQRLCRRQFHLCGVFHRPGPRPVLRPGRRAAQGRAL